MKENKDKTLVTTPIYALITRYDDFNDVPRLDVVSYEGEND